MEKEKFPLMRKSFMKIVVVLAYLLMVGVNYAAVLLPLNGRGTGEISDAYPNLFAPAGYAFSIWGLIYILLGAYVVYQYFHQDSQVVEKVNHLFVFNAILNSAWVFAWHYDFIGLSVLIMIALLFSLIKIADIVRKSSLTKRENLFICPAFSLYFGWITVATIANITIFLVYLGWGGFGLSESFWTTVVLLVGALIGSWRMIYDRFPPYGFVLIWAYGAILYKHLSESGFDGMYPSVIYTTIFCLLIFIGTLSFVLFNKIKK